MSTAETESDSDKFDPNPDDTFKILIATDCHLGYSANKRKGNIEVNDSFTTFEEILYYGHKYNVDFVILGGDLFHDARPSQNVVFKCINLLKKYCLGNKEHKIEFLTDPEIAFQTTENKTVNFESPDLNIKMPIFSIHGNHDNPNFETIGSMDVLSATGLINYFGKYTDITDINIAPIILKKGESYISLYGLNYINDERLARLFRKNKVNFLRSTGFGEDSFNMFVLHQNRVQRQDGRCIQESALPSFIDFVIWGHEHECRIEPEFSPTSNFYVCQPGSSVATSLCKAESVQKHVGILYVNGKSFKLEKIPLKTVRPFVIDDILVRKQKIRKECGQWQDQLFRCVDEHIENELMPKAAKLLTGHPKQPTEPLIRLRVFYNDRDEIFDEVRLIQKYCDEVLNPTDMIIFIKEKDGGKEDSDSGQSKRNAQTSLTDDANELRDIFNSDNSTHHDWKNAIMENVKKYFNMKENKGKLSALSVNKLNEGLNKAITKDDGDAFHIIVEYQKKKIMDYVRKQNIDSESDALNAIEQYQEVRDALDEEDTQNIQEIFGDKELRTSTRRRAEEDIQDDEDSPEKNSEDVRGIHTSVKETRGRGRGRGRGSRGGRGRGAKTDSNTAAKTSKIQMPIQAYTSQTTLFSSQSRNKDNQKKSVMLVQMNSDSE